MNIIDDIIILNFRSQVVIDIMLSISSVNLARPPTGIEFKYRLFSIRYAFRYQTAKLFQLDHDHWSNHTTNISGVQRHESDGQLHLTIESAFFRSLQTWGRKFICHLAVSGLIHGDREIMNS